MNPPAVEVADILRAQGQRFLDRYRASFDFQQLKAFRALQNCRTAGLGGHLDACPQCGFQAISYNSCRNRHCPKCQAQARERWLATREQKLLAHPHIHCVIPAGGISPDHSRWVHPRYPGFFLPVKVLSRVFRGKFIAGLKRLYRRKQLRCAGPSAALANEKQFRELLRRLHRHDWGVYAKPAFGGPRQVLRYRGRYTHRVAISNHRLLSFEGERVTFRWKDYAHASQTRPMTLTATEFLRRFFLHVLPKGFVRIRHFGFLGNRFRAARVKFCRQLLASAPVPSAASHVPVADAAIWHCPHCGTVMIIIQRFTSEQSLSRFSYFDT